MSTEGVTRWRRKFTIEAQQVTRENFYAVGEWTGAAECWELDAPVPEIRIETLEGVMRAHLGDYVIKGVQGEFYPCKSDIFEATYEPASSAPGTVSVSREDLRAILTLSTPQFDLRNDDEVAAYGRLRTAAGTGE